MGLTIRRATPADAQVVVVADLALVADRREEDDGGTGLDGRDAGGADGRVGRETLAALMRTFPDHATMETGFG